MKIGLIGAGNIGKRFCDAVLLVDGVTVDAVASATKGKAKKFADEKNIPCFFESYVQMLENADIDCVYICTTHNFHYENLLLAIKYKKHIICEKPFVLHKDHAIEIFAKAKENSLFVMEAMWVRFLPVISKAKSWIQQGMIGDIEYITSVLGFKCEFNPDGRVFNPHLGGGALYDLGVYPIELIMHLTGQHILDVNSFILPDRLNNVDKATEISIRFDTCIANIYCSVTANIPHLITVYGTNGRIVIDDPFAGESCTLYNEDGSTEHFTASRGNGFEFQIQHLVDKIENHQLESDIISPQDTIKCAEIFEKCFADNKNVLDYNI